MNQVKPGLTQIPGYNYLVDELGNIYNSKGRMLKSPPSKNRPVNYKQVCLTSKGLKKTFDVHRLIAMTFLGAKLGDGWTVDHIDGNPHNNCLYNIELVTREENTRRANNMRKAKKALKKVA